jgi:hypothetical protein
MWEEKFIGTVKEVTNAAVTILLNRNLASLTKVIGNKTYSYRSGMNAHSASFPT